MNSINYLIILSFNKTGSLKHYTLQKRLFNKIRSGFWFYKGRVTESVNVLN